MICLALLQLDAPRRAYLAPVSGRGCKRKEFFCPFYPPLWWGVFCRFTTPMEGTKGAPYTYLLSTAASPQDLVPGVCLLAFLPGTSTPVSPRHCRRLLVPHLLSANSRLISAGSKYLAPQFIAWFHPQIINIEDPDPSGIN